MSNVDAAVACFREGFSCSQAVFAAYADQLGLVRATALKIACPFGGGMGRMGETCGAVTGAYMVIGLKHGRTDAADIAAKEKTTSLVREFNERFKARNDGKLACKALLGYDLSDPDDARQAREQGLFKTLCPKLVKDAAEILEAIL